MRIGVALAQSSWPDVERTWTFGEIADYGVRAERAGFDSAWTNDHVFLELPGRPRLGGPEPFTLLSYLAARTERISLGTLVVCAGFRSVGQLAREARSLAELSGGRFILGVGAGWHQPEYEALDLPFDHRVARFEEVLEALLLLLSEDGPVDYEGRYVRLRRAQVAGRAAPPVWIGASGPRLLRLTARHAEGWNLAGTWDRFSELLALVRGEEARAGRPPGSVAASASASALLVSPDEARRLLPNQSSPGRVLIGPEELRAFAAEAEAAGCDHLILHFSGGIWSAYGPEQLELAAEALGLSR